MQFPRIFLLSFSLLFLGFDCSLPPTDTTPRPEPVVKGTDYCSAAEKHLLAIHCSEGNPTKKGKSFTDFCKETQQNGIFLNPECLSKITSCDQIDACENPSQNVKPTNDQ